MARRHALLIGCNEYQHYRRLNFCFQDVDLLKETLTEWCDYDDADVVVEKPTTSDPISPIHVLEAIRRLVENTEDGDTVLFYFAGHGQGREGKAYLALPSSIPSDIENTGVPLEKISDILRQSHRLCVRIFDACHSGVDARSQEGTPLDYPTFARAIEAERTPELNWVSLASCRHGEESYEDADLGHGFFTFALCDAIRRIKDNQEVEALPLFNGVFRQVSETTKTKGRSQHPVTISALSGLGVFAQRKSRPDPMPIAVQPETTNLLARLTQARSTENRLVCNRPEELANIATTAGSLLEDHLKNLSTFDITPTIEVGTTDLIPDAWDQAVYDHFGGLGVRSLHTIRKDVSFDRSLYRSFDPFSSTTKYIVNGTSWPSSVAKMSWAGDSYVPSGKVLCYVIPLETQVYVIVWFSVTSFVEADRKLTSAYNGFGALEANWRGLLSPVIKEAVEVSVNKVRTSVEARLNYLDRERART